MSTLIKLVGGIQIFTKCGLALLLQDWPKMVLNEGLQSVLIDKYLSFHLHEHVLVLRSALLCIIHYT